MLKIGNSHSSLLNEMLKNSDKPEKSSAFSKTIIDKLKQNKESQTLKEVFSEILRSNGKTRIVKNAQFFDSNSGPSSDAVSSPQDLDSDMDFGQTEEAGETPDTNAEVKNHLCEALIALCGGVEGAKQCLDDCCGEDMPDDGMMDQGMESEMPELEDDSLDQSPLSRFN